MGELFLFYWGNKPQSYKLFIKYGNKITDLIALELNSC